MEFHDSKTIAPAAGATQHGSALHHLNNGLHKAKSMVPVFRHHILRRRGKRFVRPAIASGDQSQICFILKQNNARPD